MSIIVVVGADHIEAAGFSDESAFRVRSAKVHTAVVEKRS